MMKMPEALRWRGPLSMPQTQRGDMFGWFRLVTGTRVQGMQIRTLRMLACDTSEPESAGWEHVSVSVGPTGGVTKSKLPTWSEMCQVKALFWEPEDVVVQFHPRASEYVNHAEALHLWRYALGAFPTPPSILVGPLASR